jgi:hypothetical protein
MRGVSDVSSSLLTRNALIRFDPEATDDESILLALRELEWGGEDEEVEEPEVPPTQRERHGPAGRASRCGVWTGTPSSRAAW